MLCSKCLAEDVQEALQVLSVSCNCTGSRISIIARQVQFITFPDHNCTAGTVSHISTS